MYLSDRTAYFELAKLPAPAQWRAMGFRLGSVECKPDNIVQGVLGGLVSGCLRIVIHLAAVSERPGS